jgi:2'-5' RNA ligase
MASRNFEGTFSVLVPIELGRLNEEFVNEYVDEKDKCKDPMIFKGRCIEDDPHITLLMGLPDEDAAKVKKACESIGVFEIIIGSAGKFSSERTFEDGKKHSWDVLWRDVISPKGELQTIHENLKKLFGVEWHFPEYKPHLTVAYLTHGSAEKYLHLLEAQTWKIVIKEVIIKKFQSNHPITRIALD